MGTIIGTSCGGDEVFSYIMKAANKKCPKFLYMPADGFSWNDICCAYYQFGKRYNCEFDYLAILEKGLSSNIIRDKIMSADIIFVGGGSAYDMTQKWQWAKLPKIFKEAFDKGIVLSGLSAGAIGWFQYGNGDSNFYLKDKQWQYRRVVGTGLVKAMCYPHYHVGNDKFFARIMKMYDVPAIALEDGASIVIQDNQYKILSSRDKAAYRFENINGRICKKIIDNEQFAPLNDLL